MPTKEEETAYTPTYESQPEQKQIDVVATKKSLFDDDEEASEQKNYVPKTDNGEPIPETTTTQ